MDNEGETLFVLGKEEINIWKGFVEGNGICEK